jgi:hypothetical protein
MYYNIAVIDSQTGEIVDKRKHEGDHNIIDMEMVLIYLDRYQINCDVIVTPINEVNSWEE